MESQHYLNDKYIHICKIMATINSDAKTKIKQNSAYAFNSWKTMYDTPLIKFSNIWIAQYSGRITNPFEPDKIISSVTKFVLAIR